MVTVREICKGIIQALAAGLTVVAETEASSQTCGQGLICPLSPSSQATVCCRCSKSCCHPENNPECPFPIWVMYLIIVLCAVVIISALTCTCQVLTRRSRARRDIPMPARLRCIPRKVQFPSKTVPSIFLWNSSSSRQSIDTIMTATTSSSHKKQHHIHAEYL